MSWGDIFELNWIEWIRLKKRWNQKLKPFLKSKNLCLFLGKEGLPGPQGPPGAPGERGKYHFDLLELTNSFV